jgi:hypothetical protein
MQSPHEFSMAFLSFGFVVEGVGGLTVTLSMRKDTNFLLQSVALSLDRLGSTVFFAIASALDLPGFLTRLSRPACDAAFP